HKNSVSSACCPNSCVFQWRDRRRQRVRLGLKRACAADQVLKAHLASQVSTGEFGSEVSSHFPGRFGSLPSYWDRFYKISNSYCYIICIYLGNTPTKRKKNAVLGIFSVRCSEAINAFIEAGLAMAGRNRK